MVKPSPVLFGRLRFTTKQVGRGFYRGNRTGSVGAHTGWGQYLIDWRKTTHYNVPDLTDFPLSPFVSLQMEPTTRVEEGPEGIIYTPEKVDGVEYLREWKKLNPTEHEHVHEHQMAEAKAEAEEAPEIEGDAEAEAVLFSPENDREPPPQNTVIPATKPAPNRENEAKGNDWYDMTRADRKALVNSTTTAKLRELRKSSREKITPQQKKEIKEAIKHKLRNALIGHGILDKQGSDYRHIMITEGRRRKMEGMPKWTAAEKEEFVQEILRRSGRDPLEVVREILSEKPLKSDKS